MDLSLSNLRRLLGEIQARPPSSADPTLDGMQPSIVLEPETEDKASKALAFCHEEGLGVLPVGSATRIHIGNFPARLDIYLSTSRLKGIVDYEHRDFTVTVRAGTTLSELEAETQKERQYLPWNPPQADRATVGGVIASGSPGIRRQPGARPRDLLLGFEGLLADGTLIKAGGRVVKNVSGYDLMKLIAGSMGTLVLITRAHLRLRSVPEVVASWVTTFDGLDEVSRVISHLRRARLDPEAVAVLEPGLAPMQTASGWTVLLRLEGLEEEVKILAEKAHEICGTTTQFRRLDENEHDEMWRMVCDFPSPDAHPSLPVVVRGQTTPRRTLELVERWSNVGPRVAFPDSGLVYARSDDPDVYGRGLEAACGQGANAVLEAGPRELKAQCDVFGDLPDGFELMKGIKNKLDPKGILSPGRFVGRI